MIDPFIWVEDNVKNTTVYAFLQTLLTMVMATIIGAILIIGGIGVVTFFNWAAS